MRIGVRLGVDVGDVRVGVARCDPLGLIATPVETVPRDLTGLSDQRRLQAIVAEENAVEVVVGLPRGLSGAEGPAAAKARAYAVQLATLLDPIPVRLCDERLSTVSASSSLRQAGKKGTKARQVIDQAAAIVILQNALETERATGAAPGEVVPAGGGSDNTEGA